MTWFLHFVPNLPNWLLSTPFDLIFAFCKKLTPFKTIWPDFYIVYQIYPIDSFQDHLTWFLHSVPNRLLSRPHDLISSLCTLIIPFKTIWSNFVIVHPIDSFSIPYCLIFLLCTQLTPFKTIWPIFINVYPIDCFQDHMTWSLHCVPNLPNWLLSRPYNLIYSMCTLIGLSLILCKLDENVHIFMKFQDFMKMCAFYAN